MNSPLPEGLVERLNERRRFTNLGVSDGDLMREAADRIRELEEALNEVRDWLRFDVPIGTPSATPMLTKVNTALNGGSHA